MRKIMLMVMSLMAMFTTTSLFAVVKINQSEQEKEGVVLKYENEFRNLSTDGNFNALYPNIDVNVTGSERFSGSEKCHINYVIRYVGEDPIASGAIYDQGFGTEGKSHSWLELSPALLTKDGEMQVELTVTFVPDPKEGANHIVFEPIKFDYKRTEVDPNALSAELVYTMVPGINSASLEYEVVINNLKEGEEEGLTYLVWLDRTGNVTAVESKEKKGTLTFDMTSTNETLWIKAKIYDKDGNEFKDENGNKLAIKGNDTGVAFTCTIQDTNPTILTIDNHKCEDGRGWGYFDCDLTVSGTDLTPESYEIWGALSDTESKEEAKARGSYLKIESSETKVSCKLPIEVERNAFIYACVNFTDGSTYAPLKGSSKAGEGLVGLPQIAHAAAVEKAKIEADGKATEPVSETSLRLPYTITVPDVKHVKQVKAYAVITGDVIVCDHHVVWENSEKESGEKVIEGQMLLEGLPENTTTHVYPKTYLVLNDDAEHGHAETTVQINTAKKDPALTLPVASAAVYGWEQTINIPLKSEEDSSVGFYADGVTRENIVATIVPKVGATFEKPSASKLAEIEKAGGLTEGNDNYFKTHDSWLYTSDEVEEDAELTATLTDRKNMEVKVPCAGEYTLTLSYPGSVTYEKQEVSVDITVEPSFEGLMANNRPITIADGEDISGQGAFNFKDLAFTDDENNVSTSKVDLEKVTFFVKGWLSHFYYRVSEVRSTAENTEPKTEVRRAGVPTDVDWTPVTDYVDLKGAKSIQLGLQKNGVFKEYATAEGKSAPILVVTNSDGDITVGVEAVMEAEADQAAEYYTLNGVKVNSENLQPGIYIVVRGKDHRKVMVR